MKWGLLLLLLANLSFAETPPPGTVKLRGGTDNTTIGNVGDALKVTASITPSGTQDTNIIEFAGATPSATNYLPYRLTNGTSFYDARDRSWFLSFLNDKVDASGSAVSVSNFPSTFGVTQSTSPWVISGNTGRTWTLSSGTDSVNVGNFPTSFSIDNFPATQPVSGTVTANQGTSPWVNNISQFGGSNVVTGTGSSGAGIPRFTISSDSSITNITGTVSLPTGAATESSLAKLTQSQGSTTSGQQGPLVQGAVTTNQPTYTTAQTSPLSLNTRGSLRSKTTGYDSAAIIRNVYSTTNVTTSSYVQLVASTSMDINRLHIFDSSGQDLVLAVGAAASEVDQIQIFPGGTDVIDLFIPSGSRISVKAVSGTANAGILAITGLK